MATPFTVFRKYTGVMMVVLCALLIFSFVIADSIGNWGDSQAAATARAQNAVVHWKGGSLNERQIEEAIRHRRVLAEFQRQVYILGTRDAMAAGAGDLPLRIRPLQLPDSYQQGVERDVVQTKIFAQRAQEAGMVVSDEMVIDYLRGLGRDRVSNSQMRTIMSGMQVGAGRRATIKFVFDLLREAILAKNYLTSHQYTFETVLPAERWDDWLRVNDRVVVEAAAVMTDDYIDQVAEPTDGELAEFFAEYQDRTPTPDVLPNYGNIELPSPKPAFATPERVKLQYVVANFDAFAERLADEVTEEEIAQYYEENKESFVEADKALFGDESLFDDDSDSDTDTPSEDPAAKDAATQDATKETEEATEEKSSTELETEQDTSNPLRDSSSEATSPAEDQSRATKPRSPFRLVALTDEEKEASEASGAEEEAAEEAAEEEEGDAKGTNLSYQPLEEVSDEIRRVLAQGKAAEKMRELMFGLKRELDDTYAEYFDATLDAADAKAEPPATPSELTDLSPLASDNGLLHKTTEAISMIDLRGETLGRSVNADETAAQPLPLWIIAFREGEIDLHEPVVTYDLDGNLYLSILTERFDRVTPELKDVRDKVVAAWKRQQAAILAEAAAKTLATKARDSGLSLETYFAKEQGGENKAEAGTVVETDPFSFLTIGNISPTTGEVRLRLSQPEPLVAPGPDLLEAVFDLEPGDVGAALNHDQSIVYLLRVSARLQSEDALRSQFLTEGDRWFGMPAMIRSRIRSAATALVGDLLENVELVWDRPADSP